MVRRLRRLLDVRPGEGAPVLLSFLYVACVVAAFLLAKPLRNALYLTEYGPYKLVYAYVAVPLALWVFVPVYTAVSVRTGTRRATIGTLLFFSLNVLLFWWAFRHWWFELLPAVFYVWVNCFGVIAPVQAWSFANSLFDARQAKRLFGVIGAGASLGAIAGGVLARFLVEPVGGTVNLLLVLAALIASAAVIVALASRRLKRRHAGPRRPRPSHPFADSLVTIARTPYLRLLAALVILVAIVTQWTTFQLSVVADGRFQDPDALTRFFGEFNFIIGAVGFVLQLLLSARAIRTFGVGGVILVLPLALVFGSAITVIAAGFTAVILMNAMDQSLRFSVDKAAYELLYLPIGPGERSAVKNTLDIIANRVGDAAGGVVLGIATGGFLMIPGAGFGIRGIAAMVFALALVWLAVAWHLSRAYVAAIGDNIHRYRIDTEQALASKVPGSVHERLAEMLSSSDDEDVEAALDALLHMKSPRAYPELRALLQHRSPSIRRQAIAALAAAGDTTVRSTIGTLMRDPDLEVRTQALLYLAQDGSFDPLRRIQQLGDFEDFSIRAATAAFLAAPGRANNEEAARVILDQMVESDEPRDRAEAARLLAVMRQRPVALLERLIADPDEEVARQAIRTAQRWRSIECFDVLLHALARPGLTDDAVSALAALGRNAVSLLESALGDRSVPPDARREVPTVLVRVGTAEAERALLAGLLDGDAPLRQRVIASLNKLKVRHPHLSIDRTAIDLLLAAEIAGHYRSYQLLLPLEDETVSAALRHSMEQELERIFRLMALVFPAPALHDAYVGIRSGNPLVRANALEYLENVLPPELRGVLLPLIDSQVSEEERARLAERVIGAPLESPDRIVAALLASDDPWLRSRAETAFLRAAPAAEAEHAPAPASMDTSVGAG
jgi:AAA family ATP:ADP antiporter